MYMDIYDLKTETGLTIEAYAFRMQGASTQWIEAKASKDGEWVTVVKVDGWTAWARVNAEAFYLKEVSDIDVSPECSGLFPLRTMEVSA